MNTPEEIKNGLKCLGSLGWKACSDCKWHGKGKKPCMEAVTEAAVKCIEALEERISLMLIQMRGDCGCCKYRDEKYQFKKCYDCAMMMSTDGTQHPLWEYEGLPGDEQEDKDHE